ncbi:MAG TPA: tetratricopeptide repeat protein [Ktedonobacterales bacterium]|nr:tetratricopeptide repeat protein [Ktedonobacterales bacterium]
MAQLPTGTVTFLFSDIQGSTRLLQQLGDDYARALGEHQALLRAAFAAHGGAEVDTQGDAFFVAFPTVPRAVAAAADATRALAEHDWPQGATLRVRIGLHVGTPQLVGDHYVGLDVHRAARIAAAGHGGQVLLSQAACDLAEHTLPAGVTLRDLGPHRLKDLRQPERIYQLILPELPADFPPLKTLDDFLHNLPLQPTPLLDREEHLPALVALLRREHVRLVTLTGPGGIGKTRLSIQVAAELLDAFPDGVWFVRLSRLSDPALVVPTIAQVFNLKESAGQPIAEVLRDHVRAKRLLLVLDNFEQVVGAASEVAELLQASAGLRVLVSSRTPLHLRGERVYPVPPLPLATPDRLPPLEQITQYAAVALFLERAQAVKPSFAITAANAPAIAEICARLDGLPLAIELAAARVRLLPPEALLARLATQPQLLSGGPRDMEARQQTMRATIAWSEDLLAPQERTLFRRLAVFVGGCTLEAAETVCLAPEGAEPLPLDVLDGLSSLVDHSLVQEREEGGEPRFGMLHVIREYALERLQASGDIVPLRQAHTSHMLALIEQAEHELTGPEAAAWLERLEIEHDNLRAALSWAREQGEVETGMRLATAARRFWLARGYLREGRGWMERLLAPESAATAPAELRARALIAGGWLAFWQGDYPAAKTWLEQALALGRAADDPQLTARALQGLGNIARSQGDWAQAAVWLEDMLATFRQLNEPRGIAVALNDLAIVAVGRRDLERAATSYAEALVLARQVGDRELIAACLVGLGDLALRRGDVVEAEALQHEALALYRDLGDLRRCAEGLEEVARTAGVAGRGERAARLLGAAAALRELRGAPQPPQERTDVEEAVAGARAALGEEAWATAFAAGRTLSLEAAIAEVLVESPPH